ncbi:MAG: asparagine synthase (glutamine-hydrolyzing) [candidate division KSB1 bacterium]|nr:asparagine synthase (glutamine-hydrolyzing) [candidate division KSB1 bacterium]
MCGIAGIVGSADQALINAMTETLAHRGPDDCGTFTLAQDQVALGHRRLSIIDRSPAGHQPMTSASGRFTLVYNGELYNHRELRQELEQSGHAFRSRSDTEVLLTAYEAWGSACLQRFTGMFAFAIWDHCEQKLFAARDQLGVKPFYYALTNGRFVFASELKALLHVPGLQREIDVDAIHSILLFLWIPAPNTIFQNILKLPAGHYLEYSQGKLRIERYWEIPTAHTDSRPESYYVEGLREQLQQAVQRQMMSEVPVGAFLSGGLDSSAIVALARSRSNGNFSTYTIKFGAQDSRMEAMPDDAKYARLIAQRFDTEHHEIVIAPNLVDLLPKILWHLDEPIADPAAINTYVIAKAAKESGTTVLLNGMGGDEIFAGYRKHLASMLAITYRRIPRFLRKALVESFVHFAPVTFSQRGWRLARWAKRFIKSAGCDPVNSFIGSYSYYDETEFEQLLAPEFYTPRGQTYPLRRHFDYFDQAGELEYLNQMCFVDSKMFLPSLNLMYSDKATMAAGVEGRPPLVDHKVVEFAFSIPAKYKIRGLQSKYIFKKAMETLLPREVIYRPKAPFGAPLRAWVKHGLGDLIDDLLSEERVRRRGYLNPAYVRRIIAEDRAGRQDNAHRIWALLTLELWFGIFVDGSGG